MKILLSGTFKDMQHKHLRRIFAEVVEMIVIIVALYGNSGLPI